MTPHSEIDSLRAYVERVRPASSDGVYEAEAHLRAFIEEVESDEQANRAFVGTVCHCLAEVRIVHALAESGILADKSFFQEFQQRLGSKILPAALESHDLRHVIRQVFHQKDDWEWVCGVDSSLWARLVDVVVEQAISHPRRELRAAITGLAQRAGALGIDEEFNDKLHEVEDYDSPFLDLSVRAHRFVECRQCDAEPEIREALVTDIRKCRNIVVYLRDHKRKYGTSLHLTRVSRRLIQQLDRLELLVSLVAPRSNDELCNSIASLITVLVKSEQKRTSLREFIRQSADLFFYQITEETAKKGQKYIARTADGYWSFLRKAMVGGAIVGLFAVFKNLLGKLPLSLGAEAAVFSINYAACFVLIYLTGSILATKQPAVTASAIAQEIDDSTDDEDVLEGVADVVVAVWRSQFISFVGNLVCAFPVALLLVWSLDTLFGFQVADASKAESLLKSVDVQRTPALFYAAVAGIYLFLAGVIAGMVNNWVVYTDIRERIRHHPVLENFDSFSASVADFVCDHLGMLTGNVALGVFLGTAGTLGVIFGLPFDIRHIAFSSAHLGTAVISAPELITWRVFLFAALGVAAIGFVNFFVSFGTTLWMTLESRAVSFKQWGTLVFILLKRLVRRPFDWYFPPSEKHSKPA